MIVKFVQAIKPGDFVRVRDPFANWQYRCCWWKVLDIDETGSWPVVTVVNRYGSRREWSCTTNASSRFKVWEPGDPRHDDPRED